MSKGNKALDASAVFALMWGEKGADDVGVHLPGAVISSVNVAEILAKLISRGVPYGEAKEALEALNLTMVSFDVEEAWASGMFVGKEISLGDRAFLATGRHPWRCRRHSR